MELIGLEKEWLITNATYKKRNKADLIQIIMEQRQLLKMLFDSLEEDKKNELKSKVENIVWGNGFDDVDLALGDPKSI